AGRGAYGSRYAEIIPRGAPGYEEGVTSRLSQFGADSLGRRLAASQADNAEDTIASQVKWLAGDYGDEATMGRTGQQQLQDIIRLKADSPDLVAAMEAAAAGGDRQVLEMFVRQVNAEMHHTSGGKVILDNGQGRYLSYDQSTVDITEQAMREYNLPKPKVRTGDDATQALPIVLEKGNDDILEVLGTGRWKDPNAVNLPKGDNGKSFRMLSRVRADSPIEVMGDEGYRSFRQMVTDKVARSIDPEDASMPNNRFLTQSYGPDLNKFGGEAAVEG
ncbi:unnamed protein product, partial [marine sediment metagenome]